MLGGELRKLELLTTDKVMIDRAMRIPEQLLEELQLLRRLPSR